jgi:hemoglobin
MTTGGSDDDSDDDGNESLYGSLGSERLRLAVDLFYRALLNDPELAPYFVGVDVDRVKRHQFRLLAQLLGGPDTYSSVGLSAAHQPLGITPEHHERVVAHLVSTLQGLGASAEVITVLGAAVDSVRDEITSAPPTTDP